MKELDGELIETYPEIERKLAEESATLFAEMLPEWLSGNIESQEQIHEQATFTKTFSKEDGLVDILKPKEAYRKFLAFTPKPGAYFFVSKNDKNIRVIIKKAVWENNNLKIERVVPEGKKEMPYQDFLKGIK